MIPYNEILEQIKPVDTQIFRLGLSEEEIQQLQEHSVPKLPNYYVDFLKIFGFQQDFVQGLFTDKRLFLTHNTDLQEAAASAPFLGNYVIIGDNNGEDFWMLRTDDEEDLNVYNWVDDEVEDTEMTFMDLLQHAVLMRTDPNTFWESNANKFWHVQFNIPTANADLLYATLPLEIKSDWRLVDGDTDAAEVLYCCDAELSGKQIRLNKSERPSRNYTLYSFDWYEPLSQTKIDSHIRLWQDVLEKNFKNFSYLDFGFGLAEA
ncbi:SMI1/KNR4 family protein [Sphingobacterium sp. Mn56C]|uniref:SMI1/KNR4 family protein n=1 Tax=Sphingobacterium sp. Mn56C TaxID=3395261 RepID=UPI003BD2ECFA